MHIAHFKRFVTARISARTAFIVPKASLRRWLSFVSPAMQAAYQMWGIKCFDKMWQ